MQTVVATWDPMTDDCVEKENSAVIAESYLQVWM
jgi:hypothetical protein